MNTPNEVHLKVKTRDFNVQPIYEKPFPRFFFFFWLDKQKVLFTKPSLLSLQK